MTEDDKSSQMLGNKVKCSVLIQIPIHPFSKPLVTVKGHGSVVPAVIGGEAGYTPGPWTGHQSITDLWVF